MFQVPEFTELLESYNKLKKRKLKIVLEEVNPQDEELQNTVDDLKKTKADDILGHNQAFNFRTYSLADGEGAVHVQLPGQKNPLPLIKTDGTHIETNWNQYARAFRKTTGKNIQDTTGDVEEQLPVQPDLEQPSLLDPSIPEQPIVPGQQVIPGQQPLNDPTAFMFDDLNKVGDHMEELLSLGFFEEINTGPQGRTKRIDWQGIGGNLRKRLVSNSRSILQKLTSKKALLFGQGIGVYDKERLSPEQAAQVTTNLAKATKIVRDSIINDDVTLEKVSNINQLINVDINGVWIKGEDLPEYGVSLGGRKRSKEELLHDPFINMFSSYDKKARKVLGTPPEENLLNLSFVSKRKTQLKKYGDVQQVWNKFLGKSYEKFPLILTHLQKGNTEKAAEILKEVMDVGNFNTANFTEYIAGIRQGEIPMTETGVDGEDLHNTLMALTKGNPTAAGLVKLYGDFSVRNYRKYAPDAVVDVAGQTGLGLKADTSYVFSEANLGKAQAMADTIGFRDPINLVLANKVFANAEDAHKQGFKQGELIYAIPVSKKITWGVDQRLEIGSAQHSSTLSPPIIGSRRGISPDAVFSDNKFLQQTSTFVSDGDPEVASRVHNYITGVTGKLDAVDEAFKKNIVDHDPSINTRDLTLSLIRASMEDEGFVLGQTTGDLKLIDDLQRDSSEFKKTKDPQVMKSFLKKLNKFKRDFKNSFLVSKFVHDGASDPNQFPEARLARRSLGYMLMNAAGSESPVGVEVNNLSKGTTQHYNQKFVIEDVVRDLIAGAVNMTRDGHTIRLGTREGTMLHLNFLAGETLSVSMSERYKDKISTLLEEGTAGASLVEEYLEMTRKMFSALLEKSSH